MKYLAYESNMGVEQMAVRYPQSSRPFELCCQFIFGVCFTLLSAYALAFTPPEFQGDLFDEAGLLTQEQQTVIKQRIAELRANEDIWAAVYLAKSLQGTSIEEAAVAAFEKWKLGQKGKDNGLLVMLAPNERNIRIEVGYGLEGTITDLHSKRIIEDIYKPAFRENQYAEGLLNGFDVMAQILRHEVPEPKAPGNMNTISNSVDIDGGEFLLRLLAVWLANLSIPSLYWAHRRRHSRYKSEYSGNVRTAFILFAFIGFVFSLFVAVFSLAFPDDPSILTGLLAANGLFGLVFFVPMLLGRGKTHSISGSGSSGDDSRWSRESSSSSSDSGSDSSSSSGGGSSGGGGASGSY